jgi:hypothetical protein
LRVQFILPIIFLLCFNGAGIAQENPLVPDHAGTWRSALPIRPDVPSTLTPQERTASATWANQVLEILRRAPLLTPASGFEVIPYARIELENIEHASESKRPNYVQGNILLNVAPYERIRQKVEANERDTFVTVEASVNFVPVFASGEKGDEQGGFIQDPPMSTETRHGHPVFEAGNGDKWCVILRNNVPFFAPVTEERYILAAIKRAEAELASVRGRRSKIPSGVPAEIVAEVDEAISHFEKRVTNARQAYASMSAAQRQAPAFIGSSGEDEPPRFLAPDDPGGTAVVYLNPAMMDSRLPRSTPQVLAIRISASDHPDLADKLDSELDWGALEAFVRQ